jgi:hypothetical protein
MVGTLARFAALQSHTESPIITASSPPAFDQGGDQLVASHADAAMDLPELHREPVRPEGAVPRDRVVVVRVDERAVDVDDRDGQEASAPTLRDCASCSPSQNSSTIFAQKAGRSSGLREDTRPSSTTTSSSTQVPSALRMSVCSEGHEGDLATAQHVGLDQRPGAVADHADRLGLLEERAREGDRALVGAQEVRVGDPRVRATGRPPPGLTPRGRGQSRRVVPRRDKTLLLKSRRPTAPRSR